MIRQHPARANRCEPIARFMTFTRRRDAALKLPVHAWGTMEERSSGGAAGRAMR